MKLVILLRRQARDLPLCTLYITDPATRARELASLQAIRDNHPKFILTRDHSTANYGGIRHINAVRWLLGEE